MKNNHNEKKCNNKVDKNCTLINCSLGKNCAIKNGCILKNCVIEDNCVIENWCYLENCHIKNNSKISGYCELFSVKTEEMVVINHCCFIKDAQIGTATTIKNSDISCSKIGQGTNIGPYARLRDNAVVKDEVKIGNFVEVKNSVINNQTKIAHLTYVGDAVVGKKCNLGCGVVFVNYNGKIKQKTIVKDNCFIGCNCNLIAPVVIQSNSYICAGTTVTSNVDEYDFVIGRSRQENKPNMAKKYLKEIVDD